MTASDGVLPVEQSYSASDDDSFSDLLMNSSAIDVEPHLSKNNELVLRREEKEPATTKGGMELDPRAIQQLFMLGCLDQTLRHDTQLFEHMRGLLFNQGQLLEELACMPLNQIREYYNTLSKFIVAPMSSVSLPGRPHWVSEFINNVYPGTHIIVYPERYMREFEDRGSLGQGGSGVVRLARAKLDGRVYAVKLQPVLMPEQLMRSCPYCGFGAQYFLLSGEPCNCMGDAYTQSLIALRAQLLVVLSMMRSEAEATALTSRVRGSRTVRYFSSWMEPTELMMLAKNSNSVAHESDIMRDVKMVVGGWLVITLEYCEDSLEARLKHRTERPTLGEAEPDLELVLDAAIALQQLHRNQLVHQDIKPDNVLCIPGDGARLADFGLAARVGDISGTAAGTPIYSAPEQRFSPPSFSADVYSLGVVLMETALAPITASEIISLRQAAAAREEPEKVSGLGDLWDLITNMLQRDPSERPSLDSVIESLSNILNVVKC